MLNGLMKTLLLTGAILTTGPIYAATVALSAEFSPDLNAPTNNKFKNTTPLGGICASWTSFCKKKGIPYSILIPINMNRTYDIPAYNNPRDGVYFKYPTKTVVTVTNENEESALVVFNISMLGGKFGRLYNHNDGGWVRGRWYWAPAECTSTELGMAEASNWYGFAWIYNGKPCAKISRLDRSGDDAHRIWDQSVAYSIITPAPLSLGSGIYNGQVRFSVGPGGDIDYGDNFMPTDSELIITFTLSVNHELKVTPLAGATDVALFPCYHDTGCTKEEADKNWERWMVTNITPQKLSGRSEFNISSSGAFTVYMQCGSGAKLDASSCPMISNKSGTVVPVKARLTLPENIENAGLKVTNRTVYTDKNTVRDNFQTRTYGIDRKGWVDFFIEQKDVKEMLKNRPDSWSGSVTLVFDPNLF